MAVVLSAMFLMALAASVLCEGVQAYQGPLAPNSHMNGATTNRSLHGPGPHMSKWMREIYV